MSLPGARINIYQSPIVVLTCLCVSVEEALSHVSPLHCQEPGRFHLIQRAHNGCDYS